MANLIDGKKLAEEYRSRIAARVRAVKEQGRPVRLDALLVGTADNAARLYAENQGKTCRAVGIEYHLHELSAGAVYDDIAGRVLLLNTKDSVHAVMVHLPLPDAVDAYSVQKLIAPEKDVEGVNPANIGNVVYGRSSLAPCTALAVIKMLETTPVWSGDAGAGVGADLKGGGLRGKLAVVVGAGDVVGKPIAVLLMRQEATVLSCNKYSDQAEMADLCRKADIIVAAAGVPGLIKPHMVRPGAVVVDVGVNRVKGADGKTVTVGDVEFEGVRKALGETGWVSPVPGGVGPMTVAMLLLNVVEAAERAPHVVAD